MPAYDYRCHACDRTTTEYPMIADRDRVRCGACGGSLERLFSPPRARPVVISAYRAAMRRRPGMVEVGDDRDGFEREMCRWKQEADRKRSDAVGRAAEELVSELGETRDSLLSNLGGGSQGLDGEATPPPAPKVPEEWIGG